MVKEEVPNCKAKVFSEGARLKGTEARGFVKKNRQVIGKITYTQQVKLFDNIYPGYEDRAKRNYNR